MILLDTNKYFDTLQPWKQVTEEPEACRTTIANCVYIIVNLAQLLCPFIPFSSQVLKETLKLSELGWEPVAILPVKLDKIQPLYERIDVKTIQEEIEKLYNQSK